MWPGIKTYALRDDGIVPNNPRLPLVLYRAVLEDPAARNAASRFKRLFRGPGAGAVAPAMLSTAKPARRTRRAVPARPQVALDRPSAAQGHETS
jgi:hypothetical protein